LMNISENVSLAQHSTMRLGGKARYLSDAKSEEDIPKLVSWAKAKNVKFMVIGHGSNIVWKDEGFNGLIIVNKILSKKVLSEDIDSVTVNVGAGEVWDQVVAWTVANGLSGLELLSLIPGTAGAAPVQNIGAYGGELANVVKEIGVYDSQNDCFESILKDSCEFSYRDSRFKSKDRGRYIITHLVLRLSKQGAPPPVYESLQIYFEQHHVPKYTPANIREAVIAIRSSKLPDPKIIANNGSFFTNPIINSSQFEDLRKKYPNIKGWQLPDGKVKLAAGWLVETAGFKGMHDNETGMATWDKQALVLVNESAKSTADLLKFRQKIIDKVTEMYGVTMQQEPELLP
jgi:UDP-N-acetylmuramate dehydrogenase